MEEREDEYPKDLPIEETWFLLYTSQEYTKRTLSRRVAKEFLSSANLGRKVLVVTDKVHIWHYRENTLELRIE